MSSASPIAIDEPVVARQADRRRSSRVFLISWALASLVGIIWALATPLGGSPDEPAHLVKAASVARGQFVGEPAEIGHVVQVPRYIADTHEVACLVFDINASADCYEDAPASPAELVDAGTTAGLYNPLYYLVVGWPSLVFDDATGIYAMRIMNALFTALFLGFAVRFAFELGRRSLTVAAIGVAFTPTLAFLSGAVNPNAVEVTATIAAFMAMLAVVRRRSDAPIGGALAIAAVSAAVGAQMRGLSPVWIALALALPLVLVPWARLKELLARRVVWVTIIAVVVAAALAGLWTVGSSSLTGAIDADWEIPPYPGTGSSPLTGFVVMLLSTFGYGMQMVGSFGWLDTPAPDPVYFVWATLTGAIVLAGIAVLRGRRLVFGGLLTLALLLFPPIFQAAYVTAGGFIWQGRYTLPLFGIAVVGIAVVVGDRLAESSFGQQTSGSERRLFGAVWLAWALSQAYCLPTALKRSAIGADGSWGQLIRSPEWSAPGGNLTLIVAYVVLIFAIAFTAWWATTRRPLAARPLPEDRPQDEAVQSAG
ncbi:DUF2142 domain-containing protein [Agromyces aerolatus]|uniref:DUF2142 domain-containing protein n=1 Tax=Agromyces sp. LY-1074 TaxID=3074080 RepID=UPI0028666A46|nr:MULTISPECIES: DUF2142 domain-containing protein [unclassified Agromyces]MDR5700381.1 DUF2142 domain-containing protein [Agromyces sp. LY-1074]MDR5706641.1 DUF2142 domain-containing protein [Agromyces sp. LY-1358]